MVSDEQRKRAEQFAREIKTYVAWDKEEHGSEDPENQDGLLFLALLELGLSQAQAEYATAAVAKVCPYCWDNWRDGCICCWDD